MRQSLCLRPMAHVTGEAPSVSGDQFDAESGSTGAVSPQPISIRKYEETIKETIQETTKETIDVGVLHPESHHLHLADSTDEKNLFVTCRDMFPVGRIITSFVSAEKQPRSGLSFGMILGRPGSTRIESEGKRMKHLFEALVKAKALKIVTSDLSDFVLVLSLLLLAVHQSSSSLLFFTTEPCPRVTQDSTHIALVEHYKSLVFGPEEPYSAGNFVEETFGVSRLRVGPGTWCTKRVPPRFRNMAGLGKQLLCKQIDRGYTIVWVYLYAYIDLDIYKNTYECLQLAI